MAPRDYSYTQSSAGGKSESQRTPFQAVDGDFGSSFTGRTDSDTQLAMSKLVRRSKSVTDADLPDLDELQPTTRRRSFFSRRKQKFTPEQADVSATVPAHRSFSGTLPSQVTAGEFDTKPPTGSKQVESKSFKVKGESDVEGLPSRPKSGKWWSWGSSSKAPKDGKANPVLSPPVYDTSHRARLELPLQPQNPSAVNGPDSSAQLAQMSPLTQPGCMSMFNGASSQQEKPVSEVQWSGMLQHKTAMHSS